MRMRANALVVTAVGLVWITTAGAEEETPPAKPDLKSRTNVSRRPEKTAPNEGTFEVAVTIAGETEEFDTTTAAVAALRRAASKTRAKRGVSPDFRAVITINGGSFAFSDPKDAQAVCRTVAQALARLRKLRAGLGDLGELTPAEPEAGAGPKTAAAERARAMQTVRQRINKAITDEVRRYRRPVSPIRMRQIVVQEIQKAQKEGLLPAPQQPAIGAAGDPADRRLAEIEYVRTVLEQALSKSQPAGAADDGQEKKEESPVPEK